VTSTLLNISLSDVRCDVYTIITVDRLVKLKGTIGSACC
jgi:hypothetical protein